MGSQCFSVRNNDSSSFQALSKEMFAKYKFGEFVGAGRLSQVIVAENIKNKKKYAIKTVQKYDAFKNKCIDSFLREKQILSKIRHPFLANIEQAFQDKTKLYLVLQYMPYGDLRDLLNERKQLTEAESKFIITCVLLALYYLSKKSIVHGDLKPQNILIDEKKFFRVGDFSSACYTNTQNYKVNGTYGYIAPEVLIETSSNIQNRSTDMYSVGIILTQMIYGCRKSDSKKSSFGYSIQNSQNSNSCSPKCNDFIQKATCENWKKRLTVKQALAHPWINITSQTRQAFVKKRGQINPFNSDQQCFNYTKREARDEQSNDCDQLAISILLQTSNIQNLFSSYDYHPKKRSTL